MEIEDLEVYFNEYCDKCKHQFTPEAEEPCNECLEHFTNQNTHKPVKWEAKE